MAGYEGYKNYRIQKALGNTDEPMASTSGEKRPADDEHPYSKASKAAKTGGDPAGKAGGGGSNGEPIPMTFPQHQRAVDHFTIKAGGTTFIGAGIKGTDINRWFRFPWETVQPFIHDWTVEELTQKWTMWKATGIKLTVKNPICIQDIGSATAGLTTAGQNLHANLYGYLDNMYIQGTTNPFGAADLTYTSQVIQSWKNHGYHGAGTPISLPGINLPEGGGIWNNNWPDVKQCAMGPGHSIEFGWKINSKYWRSTELFKMRPVNDAGQFGSFDMVRWDERCGKITQLFSARGGVAGGFLHYQDACNANYAGGAVGDRTHWQPFDIDEAAFGHLMGPWYVDPDPIPGVYFHLQPQLGALTAGLSDSICQVQWELEVDLVCSGRLPRIANDQMDITAARSDDTIITNRDPNRQVTQPFYYDCSMTTTYL